VCSSDLSPLFNKEVAAEVKSRGFELLTKRIGYVETRLADHPYLMGGSFTVADAYLFVVLRWSATVGFDLAPFPKIREYMERISKRPGVQSAMKAEGLIE
jgi:glutathione S-transferase